MLCMTCKSLHWTVLTCRGVDKGTEGLKYGTSYDEQMKQMIN